VAYIHCSEYLCMTVSWPIYTAVNTCAWLYRGLYTLQWIPVYDCIMAYIHCSEYLCMTVSWPIYTVVNTCAWLYHGLYTLQWIPVHDCIMAYIHCTVVNTCAWLYRGSGLGSDVGCFDQTIWVKLSSQTLLLLHIHRKTFRHSIITRCQLSHY